MLPSITHADEPLSLSEYRSLVEQAVSLVTQAASQPISAQRQALLTQAADTLARAHEVTLPAGGRVTLNNDALIAELRSPNADSAALRARLQALRDALADAPPTLSADELAKLRDLLSRPPFKQEVDPLTRLIDEWLSRLFGATARGIFEARYLVVVLGILLVGAVLTYFVVNLRRNTASEAVLAAIAPDDEARLTSSAALSNAQKFAVAGDYRSAVRQLYLSTLLLLDERGRLRYDRSLTNREYLRAVANTPSMRDALKPVVETFDRIWYGFAPISATEFDQYRREVEAIREI